MQILSHKSFNPFERAHAYTPNHPHLRHPHRRFSLESLRRYPARERSISLMNRPRQWILGTTMPWWHKPTATSDACQHVGIPASACFYYCNVLSGAVAYPSGASNPPTPEIKKRINLRRFIEASISERIRVFIHKMDNGSVVHVGFGWRRGWLLSTHTWTRARK